MENNNNGNRNDKSLYSCDTRAQTIEWVEAIANLLRKYEFLWSAHVVDFFQGKLWETVDKEWMDYLREESVQDLLHLPSGLVKDYWPTSLKDLLYSAQALAFPRDPRTSLQMHFPGLLTPSVGKVLAQGMNYKKKHEVEVLASVVQRIAKESGACRIIDVGAGQGYLAQVLSFEYQFPVIALDASVHHANVTNERAERIKKHYQARMRNSHLGHHHLHVPQTLTSQVISSESLVSALSSYFPQVSKDNGKSFLSEDSTSVFEGPSSLKVFAATKSEQTVPCDMHRRETSLVLAGLHACGDLSVAMLRTFLECKEMKALVSVGCCYNLLSEEVNDNKLHCYGFPMSKDVVRLGIKLGRNGRDLACQSAERWRRLTVEDAVENFEVHSFRAAFQMVLKEFYHEVLESNPTVGRLGKAQRRKKTKGALLRDHFTEKCTNSPSLVDCNISCFKMGRNEVCKSENIYSSMNKNEMMLKDVGKSRKLGSSFEAYDNKISKEKSSEYGKDFKNDFGEPSDSNFITPRSNTSCSSTFDPNKVDKSIMFKEYCNRALERLGLSPLPVEDVLKIWKEVEWNEELIGPYWSLRAVFGPILETFLLLDRLLFFQEHNMVEVKMLPIFDPSISPRNIAIIARKVGST